jgi:hypothetical protein
MKTAAGMIAVLLVVAATSPLFAQFGGGSTDLVQVSFQTNVPGAVVRLGGTLIGETPLTVRIKPGRYSLEVSKPGYDGYLATIQISNQATQMFTLTLRSVGVAVQITANVLNASIYVNGRLSGTTPATLRLEPGHYAVRLEAQGYRSLETGLYIGPNQSGRRFVFSLERAATRVTIRVPAQYLEPSGEAPRIRIYVDDQLVADRSAIVQLELQPGVHTVRISSLGGGLFLTREFAFEAGRSYELDLLMDLVRR